MDRDTTRLDEDRGSEPVTVNVQPTLGISEVPAVLLALIIAALAGFGGYQLGENQNRPVAADAVQKAQFDFALKDHELETKRQEMSLETEKLGQQLRLKVAQDCETSGRVPIILNGNVDCKNK